MRDFFYLYGKETSFLRGFWKVLGNEPRTTFFHHILPKSKYPDAEFDDEENIILLTWEEHQQVENDIYRYEEVNNRRKYLKLKYNL